MLYKSQPVTVMRDANIDDNGYDYLHEQVLIQFADGTRAVVTRGELSTEPVLVPVMKAAPTVTTAPSTVVSSTAEPFHLFGKPDKKKAKHAA